MDIERSEALMMRRAIQVGGCLIVAASGLVAVIAPLGNDALGSALRFAGWATPMVLTLVLLRRMRRREERFAGARQAIAERSDALDRLLDFAQTIQAAGKSEQIFAALAHGLRQELSLAAVAIISNDRDAVPPVQVRAALPTDIVRAERPFGDADAAGCPCLRQNLPRHFHADAPVRCAIDSSLSLPPAHAAFCIPFSIGRGTQVLVHMALPAGEAWTEERRQLAHTYVNAASSTLIVLHHLIEAEQQSMTDALTGLYNRRSMDQLMQREVALAERHGLPLSLVMIDMDHFKEVNDAHGHAAGDHLLRAFADCVRITLRKTDLAFRYGGDEFLIALPQTGIAQANQVVQKLRQAFAAVDFSDAVAHLDHQPTLSIGVAERSVSSNVTSLASLLAAADAALYEAKKDDRDCVRLYRAA